MKPMMPLQSALHWLQHAQLVGDGHVAVQRVHTDTRTIAPGDLFVALAGEKFDANTLLHEAAAKGAAALICKAGLVSGAYPAIPRVEVPDTAAALRALATGWRRVFSIPVIAVTGSNGKTTVTQMLASILNAHAPDGGSLATQGNLNNEIGVPLTVLRLRVGQHIAAIEMGMNHPGEIATLAAIAQPTVALVNNAQREHMEFMKTVRAVAEENGAVIAALPASGVAVFPADDEYTAVWQALAGQRRQVTFSLDSHHGNDALGCVAAHWVGGAWQVHAQGMKQDLQFTLRIAGRHNVKNALAAAACALAAGVSAQAVVQGLEAFEPVKGRSRALALPVAGRMRTLVDDTYNANPDSVRAAIDVLAELPGPRLLVLGDMGEVGHEGPAFHAEAGRYAKARGIERLFAMGAQARLAADAFEQARHFESVDDLNNAVLAELPHMSSLLVKGSRFMRMERVVDALRASLPQEAPHV